MKQTQTENNFVTADSEGNLQITTEGHEYLTKTVTNTDGNVYSFYDELNPVIIAAAMARLSRFGGDMRELILKEFAEQDGKEEALLRRVLTQFGDDSVQQLGSVPVVVENASNLLTKQLEWGRLAAYLEQSTRYIYFDKKRSGKYRYYTPEHFSAALKKEYEKAMDTVFDNYSTIVHKMSEWLQENDDTPEEERDGAWRVAMRGKACDAARGLLPAATTSTVGIVGSGQAIDNLIMHLRSQDLPEANKVGDEILAEVQKQHGIFFERTNMPNRGRAIETYRRETRQRVAKLGSRVSLTKPKATPQASAELIDHTPQDELELVAHIIYAHTNLSFSDIKKAVKKWKKDELVAALEIFIGARGNRRHKPGRALEVAHYTFDIVCDYGSFRDLQRHRMVDALEWQQLTPYLGYDVPQSIIDAGLEKLYKQTHDVSQKLYEKLYKKYPLEAQYATLLDHRMRWKVTMNARSAFHFIELRTQPAGHIGYRKISKLMHDEITKVHPLLAKAMIFVNRNDDDPSTSRLEQNKRAQEKLRQLGFEEGLIEE